MNTSNLQDEFLTALASVNTTVSACFTSTATLPTTIPLETVVFATVEAMRIVQSDYNAAALAPPYINVVTRSVNGGPNVREDGSVDQLKERSLMFREIMTPSAYGAPSANTPVIL